MRAKVFPHMAEADFEVLQKRNLRSGLVVKGHFFIEDAEVSGFPDVGHRAEDEPEGVVSESAADVVVAAFGEGLVLVVTSAIRELRGGNVQDALPGPFRDKVHYAREILVGVAEAHSTADSAFKVAGASAEEEGDHALVLVPDIHGAVQFRDIG